MTMDDAERRARFKSAARQIDRDALLWELTDEEIDTLLRATPPAAGVPERYAALGETSTEGPRWYIWKSGYGGNYVGGKIASWDSASAIADEFNRLAALAPQPREEEDHAQR